MTASSNQPNEVKSDNSLPVVELVLWKPKEGVSLEEAKTAILDLNDFVENQPGFISRKTGASEDDQLIDVVLWTDLAAAHTAAEKIEHSERCLKAFSTVDETTMHFKHYQLFNEFESKK